MKKCPFCAEEVQDEAIKCKHCGEMLNVKKSDTIQKIEEKTGCGTAIICLIIPGSGQFVRREYGVGITLLVLAIGLGAATSGIGWLIVGIISAISAQGSVWKCFNCKIIMDPTASICQNCQTKYTDSSTIKIKREDTRVGYIALTVIIVIVYLAIYIYLKVTQSF